MDHLRNICIWRGKGLIIKIAKTKPAIQDAITVRQEVFVKEQQVPVHIELDNYDESAIHFVGYIENKPIGASRLRVINKYGKLERICVLKAYRGKGYGKQIINKMEQKLLNINIATSQLNAQIQAVNFYKQLGYTIISKPFMDANILHVTMSKKLDR